MVNQRNTFAWLKFNGLLRQLLLRSNNILKLNNILLIEYPKSGGSWLGELISKTCSIDFPRNKLPKFRNCILHGHYIRPFLIKKPLIMWRDGRDIAISYYFHSLFYNDRGNRVLVDKTRQCLQFNDYEDIKHNLPTFLNYLYNGKGHPKFSWAEFVQVWKNREVYEISYEDLRGNTSDTLKKLLREMNISFKPSFLEDVVDSHSFERLSNRKSGEENKNSFLRKGIVGDWRNHFTRESAVLFNQLAGKELILLGYEDDESWIETVD